MTHPNKTPRTFAPLVFALAAFIGLSLGACARDDGDDDFVASAEVMNSCTDYCTQKKMCKDETNEVKCFDACVDEMNSCQVDEQDAALVKLDQCAVESCDDFLGCTINVGAQCIFGI